MTRPRKKSRPKRDSNPGPSALEADALPLGQRGGRRGEKERQADSVHVKHKLRTETETSRHADRQIGSQRETDQTETKTDRGRE